jgi:hypothetical protein
MTLRCFHTVVGRVVHVAMCHVGMMRGLFVVAADMMLCGLAMVFRRVLVMLGCLRVVFRRFF